MVISGVAHEVEWKNGRLISVTVDGKKIDTNYKTGIKLGTLKSWDELLPTKEQSAIFDKYVQI